MSICYLGIGSNLGDRAKNIKLAIKKINALRGTKVIKISGIIETKPVGGPTRQPKFLNACLKIKTNFSPMRLLEKLKEIESGLGRTRSLRYGPRIIDLDILLYDDKIINSNRLKVPHLKMFERDFVIKPLLEIA